MISRHIASAYAGGKSAQEASESASTTHPVPVATQSVSSRRTTLLWCVLLPLRGERARERESVHIKQAVTASESVPRSPYNWLQVLHHAQECMR